VQRVDVSFPPIRWEGGGCPYDIGRKPYLLPIITSGGHSVKDTKDCVVRVLNLGKAHLDLPVVELRQDVVQKWLVNSEIRGTMLKISITNQ
jgi:hypothetical protein